MSEAGCAESICSPSGIRARPVPPCVRVCTVSTICSHALQMSERYLRAIIFPLITLMHYRARRPVCDFAAAWQDHTQTLHMLADCREHRHTLITGNLSYEEMKGGMRRHGFEGLGGRPEKEQGNCLHFVICACFMNSPMTPLDIPSRASSF